MPISDYLRGVRAKVGHDLLVMPAVTGLVFDGRGAVLLMKHANGGVWVAPGGAVDPDESPSDAVVRELWEETGLSVVPMALRGVFGGPEFRVRYANGDEVGYVMAVFECRVTGGRLQADGVETVEACWAAAEDLPTLDLAAWARVVLPAMMRSRGQPLITPARWRPPES